MAAVNWSRTTFLVLSFVISVSTRSLIENSESFPEPKFDETNKNHWNLQAQWTLKNKVLASLNTKHAKNIIMFLGDGMSIPTLAATRVYLGRKHGHYGEELKLSFEVFPYTGLAKTYCVDANVADSACSGTAYLSGVKGNSGTIGLSGAVKRGDCKGQRDGAHAVTGLMDWAQKAGKSTGVVTTTRVTHASPASSYAHSADRTWEVDSNLPKYGLHCDDIATQLVYGKVGSHINVVFGGGRKNFFSKHEKDIEGHHGSRNDGKDLIREWLLRKEAYGVPAKYIYDRRQLVGLDPKYTNVLGLFSPDHMPYHLDAEDDDPTLAEMTEKAIEIVSQNKKGFFLFIEGGKIDMAHHDTKARKALDETVELAKAVEAALKLVDIEETLIVVTSDHSHTMSYSGYSKRGSDILGFATKTNSSDNLPYMMLSYANGPGYHSEDNTKRYNLLQDDHSHPDYQYPSLVPMRRETHGGDDVAVYAKGPWAHIFSGNYEQNYIPHAIAFAACIGPGLTTCNK